MIMNVTQSCEWKRINDTIQSCKVLVLLGEIFTNTFRRIILLRIKRISSETSRLNIFIKQPFAEMLYLLCQS